MQQCNKQEQKSFYLAKALYHTDKGTSSVTDE